MTTANPHSLTRPISMLATLVLLGACADQGLVAPQDNDPAASRLAASQATASDPIATIRRATARYHDLDAALADGFVFLHGCETRPDEGPAGVLYVHFDRLLDGAIDPAAPDALLYEPRANGKPRLIGVELAVPYALWTESQPPQFMGAEFQTEDEFGVWGLHVWAWDRNPEGMFAESNPNVDCGE